MKEINLIKIFIITISIIAIGITIFFFVKHMKPSDVHVKDKDEEECLAYQLLDVRCLEDLNELIKEEELDSLEEIEYPNVTGIAYDDYNLTFTFYSDEQETINKIFCYSRLNGSEHSDYTWQQLKKDAENLFEMFLEKYRVETTHHFDIFSDTGILSNDEETSYEKVVLGEAEARLTLRDSDNRYWSANVSNVRGNIIFTIEGYIDSEMYQDSPANVNLFQ